jgi:deazaflavin-dependent oxidoreductase (nitroreductase family)
MLQHIGRKSGLPLYAVIEVVKHDESTDAYYIASGWGEKADWFQNILMEPQVVLYSKRRKLPARAARLSVEESTRVLISYATRYPTAFKNLTKLMMGQALEATEADSLKLAQAVPMVRLDPHS